MSRIVYLGFPNGEVAGGQKMILRHVETLRDLGFEAVVWQGPSNVMPPVFAHRAPVEVGTPFRADDVLVVPSDAPNALRQAADFPQRVIVNCQNQFAFASVGVAAVDAFGPERLPVFVVPGRICGEAIRRLYPAAEVEIVPCFVDDRLFRPGPARRDQVAYVPRKRPLEPQAIRAFLEKGRPEHAALPWVKLENVAETEVAAALAGSSLFLSLARFESVGMTALEAMACGCVVAGFTGIGGWEYATEANGFWAREDDLVAAADALARAADLVAAGGAPLAAHCEVARATAKAWSYGRFKAALEEVWMRLAPAARVSAGPLD